MQIKIVHYTPLSSFSTGSLTYLFKFHNIPALLNTDHRIEIEVIQFLTYNIVNGRYLNNFNNTLSTSYCSFSAQSEVNVFNIIPAIFPILTNAPYSPDYRLYLVSFNYC